MLSKLCTDPEIVAPSNADKSCIGLATLEQGAETPSEQTRDLNARCVAIEESTEHVLSATHGNSCADGPLTINVDKARAIFPKLGLDLLLIPAYIDSYDAFRALGQSGPFVESVRLLMRSVLVFDVSSRVNPAAPNDLPDLTDVDSLPVIDRFPLRANAIKCTQNSVEMTFVSEKYGAKLIMVAEHVVKDTTTRIGTFHCRADQPRRCASDFTGVGPNESFENIEYVTKKGSFKWSYDYEPPAVNSAFFAQSFLRLEASVIVSDLA